MPLGPFDWTGEPFLILYGALFVLATLVSVVAPALRRPAGRDGATADADALALLAGGRDRLFSTAVTQMLTAGTLRMYGGRHFAPAVGAGGALPITGEVDWKALVRDLRGHATAVETRLRRAELLVDAETLAAMRRWATFPYLLLAGFGATKLAIGAERGRPIEILAVALVVTVLLALIRFAGLDRRSEAGRVAVRQARRAHERLRRAPTRAEMGLGVALFGTAVLAGSEFDDFHKLRAAGGDGGGSSDSSGDSGGDSGGGCGGGGCGGCGS